MLIFFLRYPLTCPRLPRLSPARALLPRAFALQAAQRGACYGAVCWGYAGDMGEVRRRRAAVARRQPALLPVCHILFFFLFIYVPPFFHVNFLYF